MKKRMAKRVCSLVLTFAMIASSAVMATSAATAADTNDGLRPVEYLDRGLIAAETSDGIFLSWRFLGNEPDGISWNVYRDGEKIATIEPRDVQPESNYETNPGVVKENTTPTNYTDPDGTIDSEYEVAPVINGVEGRREGLTVAMLSSISGKEGQEDRAAAHYVQMKPAPERAPLPNFMYRGNLVGPGSRIGGNDAKTWAISEENQESWYRVDMDLLRAFREPHDTKTPVTQDDLNTWVAQLNDYNNENWKPSNVLGNDGIISDALYYELEAKFIKYVEELDVGTSLPYAMNEDGSINTTMSGGYSAQDMTLGDFDGDGQYEIVMKWRSNSKDPMYSDPIYSPTNLESGLEYVDCYKIDGTLLFRIEMGYNVSCANDHENNLYCQDFDGDGKSELILKTALGTQIGNWDEATQTVVYPENLDTVVGGEDGLNSTVSKFKEYFATGNVEAVDTYWGVLNSFDICYRSPTAGGGNDGPNDPAKKAWIKSYHVGRMGQMKDNQEFVTAFEYDEDAGKGVIVDTIDYRFPYISGSVDGEQWSLDPMTQRANFCYITEPAPGNDTLDSYKTQVMQKKEEYWLRNPWKKSVWGDSQGNRANRYAGATGSLDGEHYSAIVQRGYYQRTTAAAYYIENGKLVEQGYFDTEDPACRTLGDDPELYYTRGNHFAEAADLDGDGKDEFVLKSMKLKLDEEKGLILPYVINGDVFMSVEAMGGELMAPGFEIISDSTRNNPLNRWAPLNHGDRSALLPVDKTNKIMQFTGIEEYIWDDKNTGKQYGWLPGPNTFDPDKGLRRDAEGNLYTENACLYGSFTGNDDEGSVAGNFSNKFPGAQAGDSSATKNVRSMVTGEVLVTTNTARGIAQGQNAIWFGSGLTHMAANGANINEIDDETFASTSYLQTGLRSTGSKSTPTLKADFWGDWREEVLLYTNDNKIAIVTSLAPTEYGIRTLMHDPMYRNGVANQNISYNQVGFASFYLGDEAELPAQRTDIAVPTNPLNNVEASTDKAVYNVNETITVNVKTDASVTRVGLNNEAGNGMMVDGSYNGVDNGDGTKTFTLTFALGTPGDRTMTVMTAGDNGVLGSTGATISFTVSKDAAPTEGENAKVISAKLVSGAMKVNTPITFEVKTSTAVSKVAFFNENGSGLAGTRTYVDENGVRTWTLTLSIGSAGKRTLDLKYQGNDGVWMDSGKTVTFTLGR